MLIRRSPRTGAWRTNGGASSDAALAVWGGLRVDFCAVVSAMNTPDVQLARYKEAAARADDTIDAQRDTIAAQKLSLEAQRQVIDLLHQCIGKMERQIEELRAAL